jgi:hypothetical protein
MHIPICPDYRDEWDQYTQVRSPYPTVTASLVRIRRLAFEELRRQEAAQRAQERRQARWFGVAAFLGVVAAVVTVVHP